MDDLVRWAALDSPGVGEAGGADLTRLARVAPPALPKDPRAKKPRHRPNNGRKKKPDRDKPILEAPPWDILRATGYPIPPDLTILGGVMPRYWRRGPRYVEWQRTVFAMWGRQCHLCKHDGADSADHLVPLSVWANQPYDPRISRPAHGVSGCATCGLKCNSSRGNRLYAQIEGGLFIPTVPL